MQEQLYSILEKLIVKSNISINKEELKLQLSSHPSYPSLHALTGVLDHFSIPNAALRLTVNRDILQQLPSHFIANVNNDDGLDLVFVEKKNKLLKITSDHKKTTSISKEQFLEQWNGIIVAIEKDEHVKEVIQKPIVKIAKWSLLALIVLLIGYFAFTSNSVFAQAHFLLSVAGLVLSIFIVKQELGLQSNVANSFCNLSEKTSCDAVLNSKGALIFDVFKLSDISIVAFSCYSLFWLLFFIGNLTHNSIIAIVTLLAFPFVIYSIYYQYIVIKKWCPLCLAIASVLTLQMGTLFLDGFSVKLSFFTIEVSILFLTALITVIGSWNLVKPLLKKKNALEKVEVEYYKFKRNFSIFNLLYNESDSLLTKFTPIAGEISLGNPKATIQLVIVTSPLCFYCKAAHRDMEYLLNRIGDKINIVIRFNVSISNKDNLAYEITSTLLDIYNSQGKKEALIALNEVYSDDVDLEKWLQNYPQNISKSYDSILETQSKWCTSNAINFTPALYVNNKLFPKEYDRTEFIYFVDDLVGKQNTSIIKNQAIAS